MSELVTLMWSCKTPKGWRRYPALFKMEHGRRVARHGWVRLNDGTEVEFPEGNYQLRTYVEGEAHYEPLQERNPVIVAVIQEKAARAAKSTQSGHGPRINLAVLKLAAEAYFKNRTKANKLSAAENARLVLNEFMEACEDVRFVRLVNEEHIGRFHERLRSRGNSERTIANKHARLKSFFRFCKIDPSFMPEAPDYEEPLPDVYSEEQLESIRKAADDYMRLAIDMAYMMGLREQELMFAEWSDINWDQSTFRVRAKPQYGFMTKDKEQRDLGIPAVLLQRLKSHREKQKSGTRLLLATAKGTPNKHLLRTLKRLAKAAGLNCGHCKGCEVRIRKVGKSQRKVKSGGECYEWTLHRFRRTCLTTMLRKGVDARTVQQFAGHTSLETTLRYLAVASTSEMQHKLNSIFTD